MKNYRLFLYIIGCALVVSGVLLNVSASFFISNVGGTMYFHQVAKQFDEIEKTSGRLKMTHLLADLFKEANPEEAAIISYLSMGRLRAVYKGTQFNFAEKNLYNILSDLLDIPLDQIIKDSKKIGDLGTYAQENIAWSVKDPLSLEEVYQSLNEFESIGGIGSVEKKSEHLKRLLQKVDSLSAKYIIRIILDKLRLGFSDMTIIDALSWMEVGDKSLRKVIENAYNICADIGLIARILKEQGIDALKKMKINIHVPIRLAAAERLASPKAIIEKIGPCVVQPKLDGFRLQIHIDNTGKEKKVTFYSRNLLNMSYMFPDLIEALKDIPVDQMICEGEAIVYDRHTGSFVPFQETVKRKRKHGIEQAISDFPLQVYLFDLLYLNGKDLLNETHEERRKKLIDICEGAENNIVHVIEEEYVKTPQELEEYFRKTVHLGLEGVVAKRPNALYQPGKRNFNWIKLKRHEEGQLEDTIDCVVLGYYAGAGKRAQFGIGAFLVGVLNTKADTFESIAKIGTGLSDEGWRELKANCDIHAVPEQPKNVVCAKELVPDIWTAPEIVCAVRADEITLSPLHSAGKTKSNLGYALRFPRFIGYRPDKSPEQATTVDEIRQLYSIQFEKEKRRKGSA